MASHLLRSTRNALLREQLISSTTKTSLLGYKNSRFFSVSIPGVGKGKTSTGLVSTAYTTVHVQEVQVTLFLLFRLSSFCICVNMMLYQNSNLASIHYRTAPLYHSTIILNLCYNTQSTNRHNNIYSCKSQQQKSQLLSKRSASPSTTMPYPK